MCCAQPERETKRGSIRGAPPSPTKAGSGFRSDVLLWVHCVFCCCGGGIEENFQSVRWGERVVPLSFLSCGCWAHQAASFVAFAIVSTLFALSPSIFRASLLSLN
jgi:hypothetical protein